MYFVVSLWILSKMFSSGSFHWWYSWSLSMRRWHSKVSCDWCLRLDGSWRKAEMTRHCSLEIPQKRLFVCGCAFLVPVAVAPCLVNTSPERSLSRVGFPRGCFEKRLASDDFAGMDQSLPSSSLCLDGPLRLFGMYKIGKATRGGLSRSENSLRYLWPGICKPIMSIVIGNCDEEK